MVNVACVWVPPKYDISYVQKLYNSVKRHLHQPFNFYCLTTELNVNIPGVIPIELPVDEQFQKGNKAWWYKTNMFNEQQWEGLVLYLDLDTVIVGQLDKLFENSPEEFNICQDFNRHSMPDYHVSNSSVMMFKANSFVKYYVDFLNDKTKIINKFKGDQDWLTSILGDNKVWWPKKWVMSYKWEVLNGGLKRMGTTEYNSDITTIDNDTSVLVFHGSPNPSELANDPIIAENWV